MKKITSWIMKKIAFWMQKTKLAAKMAEEKLVEDYKHSTSYMKSAFWHSIVMGVLVLIPLPLVCKVACIINLLHMYLQVNKYVGFQFSWQAQKSLWLHQLLRVDGIFMLIAGLGILKYIPCNTLLTGLLQAPFAIAFSYICGIAYANMAKQYISSHLDINASHEVIDATFVEEQVADS